MAIKDKTFKEDKKGGLLQVNLTTNNVVLVKVTKILDKDTLEEVASNNKDILIKRGEDSTIDNIVDALQQAIAKYI